MPFTLPEGFHLILGDVHSGSHTPSMVKTLIQWRADFPDIADPLLASLEEANGQILNSFRKLKDLSKSHSSIYTETQLEFQSMDPREWKGVNMVGSEILMLRSAFKVIADVHV